MVSHGHGHILLAGGGFAVRRLIYVGLLQAVIGLALAWFVTDGFRQQNWRDILEWRQYQLEQSEMG